MAITSPYCTTTEVRLIAPEITVATISEVILGTLIAEADYDVETDLSGITDLDTIKDIDAIPRTLNRMSVFLSRSYSYKYLYGNKNFPEGVVNLEQVWQNKYDKLLERVRIRQSLFLNSDNEVENAFNYTKNKTASRKRFGSDLFDAYDSDLD